MPAQTANMTHFLLVEDDDDHANLFEMSMSKLGHTSTITRMPNGLEAMKYLTKEAPYEDSKRPDVILLDLNMPYMSGHQVIAEINAKQELHGIPIVIVSTSQADEDRRKAYEAHASSYVVKPIDFSKFQSMVTDLENFWSEWNQPGPA